MPIVFRNPTGQSLYVRFANDPTGAANTAVDLTEGSALNLNEYTASDAAIAAATPDLVAGTYTGAFFIGTAATQANTDAEVGTTNNFRWSGTVELDPLAYLDAAVSSVVGTPTSVSQVVVPDSRTWKLIRGAAGLKGEKSKSLQVGEAEPFAVDFTSDLPTNGRLSAITAVTIKSGAAGGVTFDLSDVAFAGVDKAVAKFRITAVTAGTYVLNVVVTKAAAFGGGTTEADVTLIVVP